ncbi:MAG: hemerythrin domain-containing protein [Nanoarchaeota archaeon]|nr:hemerythrin domain-containing protein [Nanoarchaeota archaeon]
MDIIGTIKEEHDGLEREIIELEAIMEEQIINYPNLVHVLKKITDSLRTHLDKEERVFAVLENKGMNTPIQSLRADRILLAKSVNSIFRAISSGSDFKVRESLEHHGMDFISRLQSHISEQEWIFCALPETHMPSHAELESVVQKISPTLHRRR